MSSNTVLCVIVPKSIFSWLLLLVVMMMLEYYFHYYSENKKEIALFLIDSQEAGKPNF